MLTKAELLQDNEDLIFLLQDVLSCCEEQGVVLPVDLTERVQEFLVIDDDDDEHVVEIRPTSKAD